MAKLHSAREKDFVSWGGCCARKNVVHGEEVSEVLDLVSSMLVAEHALFVTSWRRHLN
jgi:hypothetical protein